MAAQKNKNKNFETGGHATSLEMQRGITYNKCVSNN